MASESDVGSSNIYLHHTQEFRVSEKKSRKKFEKKFLKIFKFYSFVFVLNFSTLKCQFLISHWTLLYNSLIKFFKFFQKSKTFLFFKKKLIHWILPRVLPQWKIGNYFTFWPPGSLNLRSVRKKNEILASF